MSIKIPVSLFCAPKSPDFIVKILLSQNTASGKIPRLSLNPALLFPHFSSVPRFPDTSRQKNGMIKKFTILIER